MFGCQGKDVDDNSDGKGATVAAIQLVQDSCPLSFPPPSIAAPQQKTSPTIVQHFTLGRR